VQLVQAFWLTIPMPVAYVPAMHATHADRPVLDPYVPTVQFRHVRPCTYVPTAQEMHVLPEPSELVPAEQFWQALLVPSIKYWPPPQHTPVPFVRQWRVWYVLQEPEQGENPGIGFTKSILPLYIVCISVNESIKG